MKYYPNLYSECWFYGNTFQVSARKLIWCENFQGNYLKDSEVHRKTVFTSSYKKKNFDRYWESSTTLLDLCMLNLYGEEKCNFTKMQRNMLKQTFKVIIHGVSAKHGYANCVAFAFLTVSESYFASKMYLDSKMFYNFENFSIWMS